VLAFCLGACSDGGPPRAVGTLERDRLDLVAEASEPVVERPVEEGFSVKAGDLLLKLDPARLAARVAQADSARARAAGRLAELVRGPRRERIREARARHKGAEGMLTTARSDLDRTKDLVSQGVASQQLLDHARASFDEALAARDASRATLDELLEGTTAEELIQAEAGLAEALAVLTDARVRLGRLDVRAPADAWVDALPYQVGERPRAGAVVAVLLADEAPYARVYVPEAVRIEVEPNTPAAVYIDGMDEPMPGHVRTVSRNAAFTPYYALTERDRGRLVYVAKVDLEGPRAHALPTGVPVEVVFGATPGSQETADVSAPE